MDKYFKGRNVEEPLDASNVPIPNLPPDFLWMHVKGSSKLRNLLTYALTKFPKENNAVVWTGSGPATNKVISCAEIMKREHNNLFQITKICYKRIDEYWEPHYEGLDTLVLNRNIPTIHILLTTNPLNSDESGYQIPGRILNNAKPVKKVVENTKKPRVRVPKNGGGGDNAPRLANKSAVDSPTTSNAIKKKNKNRPKFKKPHTETSEELKTFDAMDTTPSIVDDI